MSSSPTFFSHLKCRECGTKYPADIRYVCSEDFGPLEVDYDYQAIGKVLTRQLIESRPRNMWRYRELLPIHGEPTVGIDVGFTPLVKADRLAAALGVAQVYVKNDTVNHPTLSFKDRVVGVALSRAREFGLKTVGCASTGNLANSVAANAAAAGMEAFVFIPADLEAGKILASQVFGVNVIAIDGTYDQVNRMCAEVAGQHGWGLVNVNLRAYYAEGSKTMGFEIAEQLGWKLPDHVVAPMASGSLLCKIKKAFDEFTKLGLIAPHPVKMHGTQAAGCSPIVEKIKSGADWIKPVRQPRTIAKSLAIGDPADGLYASGVIAETGGYAENPTDDEIVAGIRLLAETTGIFAETAGGVTVAGFKRLVETGKINRDSSVVLCITGNGLKTREAVEGQLGAVHRIKPTLAEFNTLLEGMGQTVNA
jgi:threonine synthase